MLNLAFGWIWITMGFLTGAVLGMGFQRDDFMGGYNSWSRRLVRLGHIAFFGTGFLNVLVALSGLILGDLHTTTNLWVITSWCFIVGGAAMPVCCLIASKWKSTKPIFVVPVVALTLGGVLMSVILVRVMIEGVV